MSDQTPAYTRAFGGIWWIFLYTPKGEGHSVRLYKGYPDRAAAERVIALSGYKLIPADHILPACRPMHRPWPFASLRPVVRPVNLQDVITSTSP